MNAYLASVIAVAGTLLGSSLTYLFQSRQLRQTEERAHWVRLREERLAAFADFISISAEFRMAATRHSYRKLGAQKNEESGVARVEADQLQARALRAVAHLQLLGADQQLVAAATEVRELCIHIRQATSIEERDLFQEKSRRALDQFVSLAAGQLALRAHSGKPPMREAIGTSRPPT